jgi:three-Cys-motif partner protein
MPTIKYLSSADRSEWKDQISVVDSLPIRPSGNWIDTKHKLLAHYARMFATGMKNRWSHRVYLELFSGPGKCFVRDNSKEVPGSPLKVIEQEFTRFIFTELSAPAAEALAQRLAPFPNAEKAEMWCGDCAEAIHEFVLPRDALTFAFIDPTGIGHAPFELIESLHQKTRCDFLINIQHGMGIKMNMHQYTPDANEECALTRFLGNEKWKTLPRHDAGAFFRGVLDIYKQQLEAIGYKFTGRRVLIANKKHTPLYLLLFASQHPKGAEFWDKAMKGVLDPELDLGC